MTNLRFVVDGAVLSTMKAAAVPDFGTVPPCPLVPGDVITFRYPVGLAYRVTSRFFVPADSTHEPTWFVQIAPTERPL
jgi:hypothetical protein